MAESTTYAERLFGRHDIPGDIVAWQRALAREVEAKRAVFDLMHCARGK